MAQQKFCPSANDERPKCEADLLQYKCGVFFLDLPEREHLSWIGGLPDIFKKRVITKKFHSLNIFLNPCHTWVLSPKQPWNIKKGWKEKGETFSLICSPSFWFDPLLPHVQSMLLSLNGLYLFSLMCSPSQYSVPYLG